MSRTKVFLIVFSVVLFEIQISQAMTDKESNKIERELELNKNISKNMKQKLLLRLPVKLSCVPQVRGGIGFDAATNNWLPLSNSFTLDAFTAQISMPTEEHRNCILRSKEITPNEEERKIELTDGSIVCLTQNFTQRASQPLDAKLNDTPCQVKYGVFSNDLYFECHDKTLVFYGFSEYYFSTGISEEVPALFREITVEKGSCKITQ